VRTTEGGDESFANSVSCGDEDDLGDQGLKVLLNDLLWCINSVAVHV